MALVLLSVEVLLSLVGCASYLHQTSTFRKPRVKSFRGSFRAAASYDGLRSEK
jgi:hypothetical protein